MNPGKQVAANGDQPHSALPVIGHRDHDLGFRVLELVQAAPGWRVAVRPWAYALPGGSFELRVVPVPMVGRLHFGGAEEPEISPLVELSDGDHLMPLQHWIDWLHVAWLAPGERLGPHHYETADRQLAQEIVNAPLLAQLGTRIDARGAYAPGWLSWPAIDRARRRWPDRVFVTTVPRRVDGEWHPAEIRLTTDRSQVWRPVQPGEGRAA